MSFITSILGSIGGKVVEAISNRSERKHVEKIRRLEIEELRHKTKVQAIAKGQELDNSWEMEQIKNSGWKDEAVLITLLIPLWLCFVPHTVIYVEDGFRALSQTPDWYQWLILVIFTAIYGIRIWRRK
jgi:hypothetical protein